MRIFARESRSRASTQVGRLRDGCRDRPGARSQAEYVVNCGGMWGRQLGELAGVSCPLQAAEHYYVILDGVEGMQPRNCRCSRTPPCYGYFREEGSGLMVGLFEPVSRYPGRSTESRAPSRSASWSPTSIG